MSTDWHTEGKYWRPRDPLSMDHWIQPGRLVEKARTTPSGVHYVDEMYTLHGSTHSDVQHYENDGVERIEYMWGYNHPNWNAYQRANHFDVGGQWLKKDISINSAGSFVGSKYPISPGWYSYGAVNYFTCQDVADMVGKKLTGNMSTDLTWISMLVPTKLTDSELDQLGATAIARCEPTHPAADIATALGELRHDGLPSLPGKGDGNIGDEYLNLQFGWSPTIQDGRSFLQAIRDRDELFNQFVRDSGRVIRRRYNYPTVVTTSSTTQTGVQPASISGHIPTTNSISTGTLSKTTISEVNNWFSGAFTYHIPEEALGKTIAILDKTYGLTPDFETLWNLTPWSWLFDWFSNAGDVIHNMDAFNAHGLTMPYGYFMHHQRDFTTYKWDGAVNWEGTWYPMHLSDLVVTETKQRRRADPFGFGLSWDGFDSFQLSILAALGISRVA